MEDRDRLNSGMKKKIKRIALLVGAFLFLLLGIIGLVLPFLQGFLFIGISLMLFSLYSTRFRDWLLNHTQRYPRIHAQLEKIQSRISEWIGEV